MDEIIKLFINTESKVAIVVDDPAFMAFCQELENRNIKVWNGETDIYCYSIDALNRNYGYLRYDSTTVTATRATGYEILSLDAFTANYSEEEIEEQASLLLWS